MENLIRLLKERGIHVTDTNPVRKNWRKSPRFVASFLKSDIVIVNGEGTLHGLNPSDMEHRSELVKIAHEAKSKGKKAVLLNTVYQANPPSYKDYLTNFDLISVRESRSQAELRKIGIESRVVPDLSFATDFRHNAKVIDQVFYTDSAIKEVSARIREDITKITRKDHTFLKITTRSKHFWLQSRQARTYLRNLARAEFVLSGRFHATTLSLLLGRPFLAYKSNTFKVESMLEDIGLTERLIDSHRDFATPKLDPFRFTEKENQLIHAYVCNARKEINTLIDDIRRLLG